MRHARRGPFEELHSGAVGIEGVHVVNHDELIAVPKELGVYAKGGGVALDPAPLPPSTAGKTPNCDPQGLHAKNCPRGRHAEESRRGVANRETYLPNSGETRSLG